MRRQMDKIVNKRRLSRLKKTLKRINAYQDTFRQASDETLKRQTQIFRERLADGETLTSLLPEAYAVLREASWRVLGMYPKDVQVLGAIVLHEGHIAEMQTGEGKTLTATMPLYLNGLTGQGAYLITTNDYLARRDCEEMTPLFEWLGLSISLGFVDEPDYEYAPGEKAAIYAHDIIYTTNGRLGFDYLIDNLADGLESKFLPSLYFGIIDEVDSIVLDSAQTPLVISGAPRLQSNLFGITKTFVETLEEDIHYEIKKDEQTVWLTPEGITEANHYFGVENIYEDGLFDLVRNINLALRGRHLFEENLDYFLFNGEVVLIDRITGRMLPGTKLQSGLHQAIEAKEGVDISVDMSAMATITFQNLFRQFEVFSGMSATSKLGEKDFFDLYHKIVVQIPTDKPIERIDMSDRVFKDNVSKNNAIVERVCALHQQQRPVLLITRTAETAEYFSMQFFERHIPNNLLIAQNVAKEAQMIAEAGQLGAVTVATSMAGRGTDIKLGEGVKALGGLAVIVSEHMENSRVDRQLRGRAGRQGDPGTSQFYISLEDYIVERWGKHKLLEDGQLDRVDNEMLRESRLFQQRVKQIVTRAQRVSEEQGEHIREMANEYEKSISAQREIVYAERNRVLKQSEWTKESLIALARDVFQEAYHRHQLHTHTALQTYIYQHISFQYDGDLNGMNLHNKQTVVDMLVALFEERLAEQERFIGNHYMYVRFMQKVILKAIDSHWIDQVDALQQLRNNINNRQNGQRNAIFEYHRVAMTTFEMMCGAVKAQIVNNLCQSVPTFDKKGKLFVHFPK
ncbi:accessory Sec system translocase SecA2 [Staphylococcus muscae]|uniref:Protein translocase subunit SecA n=1 Tax=Staphylococcus muscae TaxID=1294 RepID=A0A240BRV8_9STAP|nr:accessory Sec system translocase SecA2 [Staphylococcus muscae]AVQ34054.1 accessory Sec system translocase SecA2 [Staphylococcus muscae]PNZ03209.1 accessory Sec system translocase SecA2 [Staphylococcus muscae]GGA82107.1 protein translocase subunit SecA 2 [Staphylococcus muscae]SNV98591.1 Protein export cytoplasm protein SecA2 ATPase RNA helicase [Staphylococcus muscae]